MSIDEVNIDECFRVIVERENLRRLLRLALDEMNPRCENCVNFSQYDKGGVCYAHCKWQHEEEARKLLGEKEAEHEI